jgi:mycofactocin precursor
MPDNATELLDRPAGGSTEPQAAADGAEPEATGTDEIIAADTLVEEISIDGMCGVY